MALADFHYTTGISSGFKVYILEGEGATCLNRPSVKPVDHVQTNKEEPGGLNQVLFCSNHNSGECCNSYAIYSDCLICACRMPNLCNVAGHSSFENEQRFHRLPAHRLPACSIKRKPSLDVRRLPEGQKASKVRRLACLPVAASLGQVAPPAAAQLPVAPIAVSCVVTSSAAACRDSRGLPPSCPQKRPLREPPSEPALTVAQLQQMRPSVITCAPRRSCPEALPSTAPPPSPAKQKDDVTSNSPHFQRLCPWTTNISASFSGAASPRQTVKEADRNL